MLSAEKTALLERVETALVPIRPHLRQDGGDLEVVDITDDFQLKIRWVGRCQTCSMSDLTLRAGVAEAVRGQVPEITHLTVEA